MRNIRKCKEKGCQGRIPMGKSLIAWYCRVLGYCRYCYRMYFPVRRRKSGRGREELEQPLSWSARREAEWAGFNQEVWSPEFRKQVRDLWDAQMRGEIKI